MAAMATPGLHMCLIPQQTTVVNTSDCIATTSSQSTQMLSRPESPSSSSSPFVAAGKNQGCLACHSFPTCDCFARMCIYSDVQKVAWANSFTHATFEDVYVYNRVVLTMRREGVAIIRLFARPLGRGRTIFRDTTRKAWR